MIIAATASLLLFGCAKEPIYDVGPPLNFVSWSDIKDTNWTSTIMVNNKSVNVHAVANYQVFGMDTQTSVKLSLGKNDLNIEQIAFAFRNNARGANNTYTKGSLANVYLETKTAIFSANDLKIDTLNFKYIPGSSFKNFELANCLLKLTTNSIVYPNISFDLESSSQQLNVSQSFFEMFNAGKSIAIEKDYWSVDLKGGSEFAPSPTIDFKYDWKSPNDLIIFRVKTEALRNNVWFPADKNLLLKKKGIFYASNAGDFQVKSFYYKGSLELNGRNWNFTDTLTSQSVYKIDSLRIRSYYMPF
jgi:hypothetical protein